jgi:nitrous oxidase accessory protein NosD
MKILGVGLSVLLGLCAVSSSAREIRVPLQEPSIQAGIDAAEDGDVVLVAAGTYVENIDFLGKDIAVESESGADSTTIDGSSTGFVVRVAGANVRKGRINGFHLSHCEGGIEVSGGASVIIERNFIDHCIGPIDGIDIENSSASIVENEISGMTNQGIFLYFAGHVLIDHNRITANALHGLGMADPVDVTVVRNVFMGNMGYHGSAIFVGIDYGSSGAPIFADNLIVGNSATESIIRLVGFGRLSGAWVNNTIADNDAIGTFWMTGDMSLVTLANNVIASTSGQAVFCEDEKSIPKTTHNDFSRIYSQECNALLNGPGNIQAEPDFKGTRGRGSPWLPSHRSPLIDAGDNSQVEGLRRDIRGRLRIIDGGHGDIVDIGAFEYDPAQ